MIPATTLVLIGLPVALVAVVALLLVLLVNDFTIAVRRDWAAAGRIVRRLDKAQRGLGRRVAQRIDAGPLRLQQQRVRGWSTPDDAIRVGRGTRWGNPWKTGDWIALPAHQGSVEVTPELAVELYVTYVGACGLIGDATEELAGRDLVCWCKLGQPCHAEWLLEVVNRRAAVAALSKTHGYIDLTWDRPAL